VFVVLGLAAIGFRVDAFSASRSDPVAGGYYQRLTSAFLHGHLAIDERPPSALLTAPNPYAVTKSLAQYRHYGIQDASLYKGRYYYYWGPAPVVTVVIPARAVGVHLTETDVGLGSLLVIMGAGCGFALLVARRCGLGAVMTGALAVVAATPFSAWFQLPRLSIYEANILFAAAAAALAVLCFVAGSRRFILFGGCLTAIATMSRLEAAAVALLPVVLAVTSGRRRKVTETVTLVGIPLAGALALLLAYNQARFGSPLQFGQKYVLGVEDFTHNRLTSIAYIRPSLAYYLVNWLRPSLTFPYFNDPRRFTGFPPGYLHFEPAFGALWTTPALACTITAGVWFLVRRWRTASPAGPAGTLDAQAPPNLALVGTSLVLSAFATLVFASYAIFHASQRFRILFDVFISLAAVALIANLAAPLTGGMRRICTGLVVVVALVSIGLTVVGAAHGVYPTQPSLGRAAVRHLLNVVRP
jgi:hypothetical protein